MSLFESKVFWFCAVVCIGIAGFLGVNAYKSNARREPVTIYKTTHPAPVVKSSEKTQVQGVVDQAQPSVETVDSLETEIPGIESVEAEGPIYTPDDPNEELTVEEPQFTSQNEDTINEEIDLDFDAGDFSAELQKRFMSVMNRYPLLSMSESEIFKLMQTSSRSMLSLRI